MPDTLSGFPFWSLEFEKDGTARAPGAIDRFVSEVKSRGLSDVFVFSHGWNNDHADALSLYERFFGEVARLLQDPGIAKKRPGTIGVAGVLWPSILWPDDAPDPGPAPVLPPPGGGGAASMSGPAAAPAKTADPAEINGALKGVYDPGQQGLIDELTGLLAEQPESQAAIDTFRARLADLLASEPAAEAVDKKRPDLAEAAITELDPADWRRLLDILADSAEERGAAGGAVGLGTPFKKLWEGAKNAMRIATYWQMKQRAGIVGRAGLAPAVSRLAQEVPGVRIHLLGHSFGARLVSFSLSGLPAAMTGASSPVKSLFLLQGAFSHYAFSDRLPHDMSRSGALKGLAARVDGPLLTTHSLRDYAVGVTYPAASFVNGDDASAAEEQSRRWGAMGNDGAQAVGAASAMLAPPGTPYPFSKGAWLNLDGNKVIVHGRPPAGAHSDIVSPHTAWAALAAAGIV